MKKRILSMLAICLLMFTLTPDSAFALKRIVNVSNFSFSPSNINNVQIGDTIRWVWVSGTHTTTSTSVPSGAATWDSPITSTVTSYEYRVTTAGTYNYVCTPHASMGMTGSFTVVGGATLNVSPVNQNVAATAGNTSFTVTTGSAWTASSNQPWCTVTSSGNGNGTLTATYTANFITSVRVANITVTVSGLPSQTVTVTQAAAAATLTVLPPNRDVTSDEGSTTFSVTSNSGWTSSSNQTWCTVNPSGTGNGTINAGYSENTSIEPRVATITVTVNGIPSETVTVSQAGAAPSLVVGPSDQVVSYEAGSVSFSVTSNTTWTAQSNVEWCTVTAGGTGDGEIIAEYGENPTFEIRVATITVSVSGLPDQVVTLSQEASTISVKEIDLSYLKLYPNPADSYFIFNNESMAGDMATISVMTMTGQVVLNSEAGKYPAQKMDISSLKSGMYIARLRSGDKTYIGKLQVNH